MEHEITSQWSKFWDLMKTYLRKSQIPEHASSEKRESIDIGSTQIMKKLQEQGKTIGLATPTSIGAAMFLWQIEGTLPTFTQIQEFTEQLTIAESSQTTLMDKMKASRNVEVQYASSRGYDIDTRPTQNLKKILES